MRKQILNGLTICTVLAFLGCQTAPSDSLESVAPSWSLGALPNEPSGLVLSDRFELGTPALLSSTETRGLGEIEKIVVTQAGEIVISNPTEARLLVYDKEGKFLRYIGQKGQGAGEQTALHDFFVLPATKEVYILSNDDRAMNIFGWEGDFKRKVKLGFFADAVQPLSSDRLVFYTNYNTSELGAFNLLVTDLNAKVLEKYLPYENLDTPSLEISGFLQTGQEVVLCATAFGDTVYTLTREALRPAYVFPWGEKGFKDFATKNPMELIMELPNRHYLSRYFVETPRSIVLKAVLGLEERLFFFNRKTNAWTHSGQFDERSLLHYMSAPLGQQADWVFGLMQVERMAEALKENPALADFWKNEHAELAQLFLESSSKTPLILVSYRVKE